jgi:hypothetical protein
MKKVLVLALLLLTVASLVYAVCFLDFVTESLPAGTVNQAYSFQIDVCCGTPPYTFSIHSGSLPTGLSLSSSGLISGTPTSVQYTTVFIRLTDSASPNCTLVRAYEIYID